MFNATKLTINTFVETLEENYLLTYGAQYPEYPNIIAFVGRIALENIANSAADLGQAYPKFFWNGVRPYIEDALGFLQVTQDGKAWIANLYGNVFAAEHGAPGLGRPG